MNQKVKRGLIHDTIGDMLTRIRNACLAKKSVVIIPFTEINQKIIQILEKEGFIHNFEVQIRNEFANHSNSSFYNSNILIRLKYTSKKIYGGKKKESCIINLKRLSKPGLRLYANNREIPRILGGVGILFVSTPEGIMTDREARLKGIGGELLCSVW